MNPKLNPKRFIPRDLRIFNESMNELKDHVETLRKSRDYVFPSDAHIIVMCDGRSFSKLIKKQFKLPFDDEFIELMNETAKYVCENVEGVRFAYVQSDEISFYIHASELSNGFFRNRLCKLQSLIAAMCTGKFIQLYTKKYFEKYNALPDFLIQFDCKVWDVPDETEVWKWFVYRQMDCMRNAKQQYAQALYSHKQLMNLTVDEQIQKIYDEKQIDYYEDVPDYCQNGRVIYKIEREMTNEYGTFMRHFWEIYAAMPFNHIDNFKKYSNIINA